MAARGWRVHVIAATRAPGRAQGSEIRSQLPGGGWLIRRVNNLPWRPLGRGERDPETEARVRALVAELDPQVIHIQHLLFLSAHLSFDRPTLGTLHDAWAVCPRAGSLLRDGREPCAGPPPATSSAPGHAPQGYATEDYATLANCAACYAGMATGAAAEHALGRLAGAASPLVPTRALHRAWRRLPPSVRGLSAVGRPRQASSDEVAKWRAAVSGAWRRLDERVAPSRWYAALAERHGLGETAHLPHGVDPGPPRVGGGPLIFLGSLVPHKGAHLVVAAHAAARAAAPDTPPLRLVGPATDPVYAASLPAELLDGPAPPAEVPALLARASALVIGSTWPENAPLVVLEARASGCPVIAPAIGGLPELIEDGVDGALYTPGDAASMASAIRRVLANPPPVRAPPSFTGHLDALEARYRFLIQRAASSPSLE